MAYKALYRTYRPTTFDEVAGQQHIVKTIKNALATGKIAHAYLFAGPRGTGKTTMAKLLAKTLNCEQGIGHQCNKCKNCKAILEGTHPDVLEIDAASNNGVDEIRDLIDKVKYGTILGRYKVYIIDEVHMMTPGAFNALLKTLEEPPAHVIFILATTEPHKILPTILSRCQRYDFSKVSDEDIRGRLKVILDKEHIEFNEDAVNLIISLADGGMRDALSILDQVLAYSGDKLNVQDVLDIFALESTNEKINLLHSILNGDVSDVLDRLNNYIKKGTDIKRLTNDLLMILKDVLIYNTSSSARYLQILKEDDANDLCESLDNETIMKMINILMETLKDYKNVTAINPLFEVTLLKLASLNSNKPINNKEKEIELRPLRYETPVEKVPTHMLPKEDKAPEIKEEVKETPVEEVKKEEPQVSLFEEEKKEEIPSVIEQQLELSDEIIYINGTETDDSFAIDDKTMVEVMVISKREMKNQLLENWKSLKKLQLHPKLGKAATMLIDGHPLVASNKVLVVEYPTNSIVEKMNNKANQQDIQNVIFNTFNKKMFVYAVNRAESVRLQQKYMNLLQLGKLPKADTINIDFIGD